MKTADLSETKKVNLSRRCNSLHPIAPAAAIFYMEQFTNDRVSRKTLDLYMDAQHLLDRLEPDSLEFHADKEQVRQKYDEIINSLFDDCAMGGAE